jgi:formyltetrahydrofolate deformylase
LTGPRADAKTREPLASSPPTPELATLLVSCPDRRGIVAALSQVLFGHGANILDSDQHTDPLERVFFQRIRFDLSELLTDRGTLERAIAEVSERFGMSYRLIYAAHQKRVALFVSKHDHCLYDLLLRKQSTELACEIPLVISNHAELEYVARQFGVPFVHIPKSAASKQLAEDAELARVREARIDLIVLARYMQILSSDFVERAKVPIINIHHSFLPAFIGQKPYHQAHERGVKLVGATAHYATAALDQGPIIGKTWCVARIATRSTTSCEKAVISRRSCSPAPCARTSTTASSCAETRPWCSTDESRGRAERSTCIMRANVRRQGQQTRHDHGFVG